MAKNIEFMGAIFPDVPSIKLPQQGGGLVSFDDTTDADATAADILAPKTAYVNGVKVVGTGSGGGGGTVKRYGIRPDAELVNSWSYDKQVVRDEHVTIPAYSTTNVVLIPSADIATYVVDHTNYAYLVTERILSIPIYKSSYTGGAGKQEYVLSAINYELVYAAANAFQTLDGSKAYATANPAFVTHGQHCRFLRWSNATTVALYTSAAYGVGHTYTTPTIVANGTLTVKTPPFQIRGHATYLNQATYEAVEDIRNQYVIELWRAPKSPTLPNGWDVYSGFDSIMDDIKNNNHKLR